jgi:putative oxidoreductase
MQFFNGLRPLAQLLLRLGVGTVLLAHGYVKLVHMSPNMRAFGAMGLPPWLSVVAGFLEAGGGLLLILGLFSRVAALLLFFEMCFAIGFVHWRQGNWWQVKNYELALVCAVSTFAIAAFGPGRASLDRLLLHDKG